MIFIVLAESRYDQGIYGIEHRENMIDILILGSLGTIYSENRLETTH